MANWKDLHQLLSQGLPPAQIARELRVPPSRLARMLRSRHLERQLDLDRRARDMFGPVVIGRAFFDACRALARIVEHSHNETARKACMALIRMAQGRLGTDAQQQPNPAELFPLVQDGSARFSLVQADRDDNSSQ